MKKDNKPIIWIIFIIFIIYLANNPNFLGSTVNLKEAQIQYYNKPIVATITTDLENPIIETYFDSQLLNITPTQSNQSFKIEYNSDREGTLKVIVTNPLNTSEKNIQQIEVKKPFVDAKYDFPTLTDKGTTSTLKVQTFTPQGEALDADSVDLEVVMPDTTIKTIIMDKSGNTFTTSYNFADAGNYIFKINARKANYDILQKSTIVSILKPSGVHPIIYIWAGALLLWIILFIVRKVKK